MSLARCTAIALAIAVAACSSKSDPKPQPAPQVPADASIDGITNLGGSDPNAHLDDIEPTGAPLRPSKRPGRPIEIVLRSSPTGARVQVDGVNVGLTPAFWAGETGAERQFTFTLDGHATAHYKFWPTTSGTVHARLDPVTTASDAGVPPAEAPAPIAPPATILTPDAGVPKIVPPSVDAATVAPPVASDAAVTFDAAPPTGIGPQP